MTSGESVDEDGHFGEAVAEEYDASSEIGGMFAPEVVDPAVDLLAQLAGDGPALEFGIGTGRIALPLSARGIPVDGIDLSRAMLRRLAAKPGADAIGAIVGDFASARAPRAGSYSLVYLVFNTIQNLTSQDAQVDCFANAAVHLRPGGAFVIEVGMPDLRRLPPGERYVIFDIADHHVGFDEYDVADQGLISHHFADGPDGRWERSAGPFRYVWPAEMDLMARMAGMRPRERWSGWRREPFTSESRTIVAVWEKGELMATTSPIPIGLNLTTMGVSAEWWLESAPRIEAAGFRTLWAWDHYMTFALKDRPTTGVLECWTLLSAVAARTTDLRVGSFVANAMNHHPAVLARHAMTIAAIAGSGTRMELGIGIGGHPAEHHAYGIEFPEPKERASRLVEQIAVVRGLFEGGPFSYEGAHYALKDAYAHPVPAQMRPRLIIGAEKPAGARIAARHADGMTTFAREWDVAYPAFLAELERTGRSRDDVSVICAIECFSHPPYAEPEPDLLTDLGAVAARWAERGADELLVHWATPESLDGLLAAGERAGLRG